MKGLRLAKDFALPLDAVTETLAILGIRGSGKSTTATVLVEELLAQGQQVLVIDPTDVWWGLKSSADGTGEGYPVVILGGQHADLPLGAGDGRAIADFAVDHHASLVCALRHFESQADMRRFVTDLCQRLYHRKGELAQQTPVMLVIDEASLFVPQRVTGEQARMVSAIQRLVRQGRASGFGVTLIDQRASTVNKDVLTQLELLVAHRTSAPQDRKALEAWIEQHDAAGQRKEFLTHLASLPRGTAWFWSPGWLDVFRRVAVRASRTFDSRRTPKAGERAVAPVRAAAVDLEALKGQLETSIARARDEDPKLLRARIRELEAAGARREAARATTADVAAAEATRALQGRLHELELRQEHQVRELRAALATARADSESAMAAIQRSLDVLEAGAEAPRPAPAIVPRRPAVPPRPAPPRPSARVTEAPIGRTPQRILDALRFYEDVGEAAPTKQAVAAFVGVRHTTGTFSNYLSQLRTAGLIGDASRESIRLTATGRAAAADDVPGSRAELHAVWMAKLGGTPRRMLELLIAAYPGSLGKEELAAALGISHTTGTFSNYLSQLRVAGLLRDVSRSAVSASDLLFPAGLP